MPKPGFEVPSGACDCHAHICGPSSIFPYAAQRVYTPPDALLPDFSAMLCDLGIERAVLVQPSVYGTDNAAMLDAIRASPFPCRGVAVVPSSISERELEQLHEGGVRGVRFNLIDVADRKSSLPISDLRRCADKIKPLGWHLELQIHVDEFPDLDLAFAEFPVDIVLGHFGYPRSSAFEESPGFRALLRLIAKGHCWVKLSGPYRLPVVATANETRRLAQALVGAAPERLVWGTDWPHTNTTAPLPDDAELLELLAIWVPDSEIRRQILVDNPAALYGF